jgi:hypothetical protein
MLRAKTSRCRVEQNGYRKGRKSYLESVHSLSIRIDVIHQVHFPSLPSNIKQTSRTEPRSSKQPSSSTCLAVVQGQTIGGWIVDDNNKYFIRYSILVSLKLCSKPLVSNFQTDILLVPGIVIGKGVVLASCSVSFHCISYSFIDYSSCRDHSPCTWHSSSCFRMW